MKICVLGLWHLGSITAACLSKLGHTVIGIDSNKEVIKDLQHGKAPIYEPGLDELIKSGINNSKLTFSLFSSSALTDIDVLWITFDTPVDEDDNADIKFVMDQVKHVLPFVPNNTIIIVSSQLPVGSISKLEEFVESNLQNRGLNFISIPENLRLGNSIDVFLKPDRIIVGVRKHFSLDLLNKLISQISNNIIWMSIESAEMTKHAINSFLAISVTYANEIATLCEIVGADAKEVEKGLRSESRIGPKAYLSPGGPFAGGTLARDINFLEYMGRSSKINIPVISSVNLSNNEHKKWTKRKLSNLFENFDQVNIAIWGLTYKPGTSTLRRSLAVELVDWLINKGSIVKVFDPVVNELPKKWAGKVLNCKTALDAVDGVNVLVVGTNWPEFKESISKLDPQKVGNISIIDINRHLCGNFAESNFNYITLGGS